MKSFVNPINQSYKLEILLRKRTDEEVITSKE
jgi:hypothetical protein